MDQTLNFLGIGSAFNNMEFNNCAYIIDDHTLFLIDCGENIFKKNQDRFLLNGIEKIHIIITHTHSDHIGSLPSLVLYLYYIKNIKPDIYYPDKDILDTFLSICGVNKEHWNYCEDYNVNNKIHYSPVEVNHVNNMDSYGYIIEYNSKNIFYSGDCSKIPSDIINNLLNNNYDEFYIDTCYKDYEGNVHYSFNKLCDLLIPHINIRKKVFCMHIDDNRLFKEISEKGFNFIRTEG